MFLQNIGVYLKVHNWLKTNIDTLYFFLFEKHVAYLIFQSLCICKFFVFLEMWQQFQAKV
jgi:hypothetical protein